MTTVRAEPEAAAGAPKAGMDTPKAGAIIVLSALGFLIILRRIFRSAIGD